MKRKVVSLMLVSAMVAGMLAGCGSDSGSSKGGFSPETDTHQRQRQVLQARQQMTNLRLPLSILTLMVKTATGITR